MRTPDQYNDGQWHNLTIVFGQKQMIVYVDRKHSQLSYQGLDVMKLDGFLYLGKLII